MRRERAESAKSHRIAGIFRFSFLDRPEMSARSAAGSYVTLTHDAAVALTVIMHDAGHFSNVLSERALAVRSAGSV
jgi:hypothetical protein